MASRMRAGDGDDGAPGPSGVKYSKGRISDCIPFKYVAEVLEKIRMTENAAKKKELLKKKLIDSYRKTFQETFKTLDSNVAGGDSLYPIVRILLPTLDRGRRSYGFQAHALGRMFVQVLGIDKDSKDGKRLIRYKDPAIAGPAAGDMAELIYQTMTRRFSSNEEGKKTGPTLSEIHSYLDKLARDPDSSDVNQEHQKKVLQSLVRKLTAVEVKWLARILLKDLRLGFSSTKSTVFGLLHKQARSLSEKIGDLELLCQKLNDPSVEVSETDVSLGLHFSPMLSTRMDIIDSAFEGSFNDSSLESSSKKKQTDPVTLPPPPFYVETKWDGERFQIHFDGKDFKYFSRRAFDYSKKFNETLTPRLRPLISSGVRSFIMDGEMMAFNKTHKIFTQKGYKIDVKTMNSDNLNHCPAYVAFDLLYLNGNILTKLPLKERREKLISVFQPKDDVIRVSEVKILSTKQEVVDRLDEAIAEGDEGLIVKNMNSPYLPGKRPLTWLKIKPEYLEDNSVEDLDLLIIGAYYTDSNRGGGAISHFLVGLIDKTQGKQPFYYPVTTVGTGRLRSVAVRDLLSKLRPKFLKCETITDSNWCNIHFKQRRKKPDFLIKPKDSIVVQVKASEITPSDAYAVGYTLRFPRVVRTREDKSYTDIMTVQEFNQLREACGGRLAKRSDGAKRRYSHPFQRKRQYGSANNSDEDGDNYDTDDEDGPTVPKRPNQISDIFDDDVDSEDTAIPGPSTSTTPTKALLSGPRFGKSKPETSPTPSYSMQAALSKNIFNFKWFCVFGTTAWKADMENKLRQNGGNITHNPDVSDLFCIIGQHRSSPRVDAAVRSKKYDVISPSWVLTSIENGKESPLTFSDYWGFKNDTKENLIASGESYSESYSQDTEIDEKEQEENNNFSEEILAPSPSQTPPRPSSSASTSASTTPSKSAASSTQVSPVKKAVAAMKFDDDSSSDTDMEDQPSFSLLGPGETIKPEEPNNEVEENPNEEVENKPKDEAIKEEQIEGDVVAEDDSTDFSEDEVTFMEVEPQSEPVQSQAEIIKEETHQSESGQSQVETKDESRPSEPAINENEDECKEDPDENPESKFLSEVEVVFRGTLKPELMAKFKRFGGQVGVNEDDESVTHIVICNEGNPSKKNHPRALVVTQKWLEDCLNKRTMIDEWVYLAL